MNKLFKFVLKITTIPGLLPYFKFRMIYAPPHDEVIEEGKKKKKRKKPSVKGRTIILSNHVAWYDPVMFDVIYPFREIWFLAAKDMFSSKGRNTLFRWLGMIPTDRYGTDITGFKKILKLLKEDKCVAVFPEGQINPLGFSGELQPFHAGTAAIASKTDPNVLPILFYGKPGFLRRMTVVIGTPFKFSDHFELKAARGEKLLEITDFFHERVEELKNFIPERVVVKEEKRREKERTKKEKNEIEKTQEDVVNKHIEEVVKKTAVTEEVKKEETIDN